MKNTVIYDLDGTLLDSYGLIVESLNEMTGEDKKYILDYVIQGSVDLYLEKIALKENKSFDTLKKEYSNISSKRKLDIRLIDGALDILEYFYKMGITQHIFTHRGDTTIAVLENLGIRKYFKEIITSLSGFERKPSGQALKYIVEKYGLDKKHTYYVGDRVLDVKSANDANINSILFIPSFSVAKANDQEDYLINDLRNLRGIIK